ncbi:hypothetical protein EV361DRAFT_920068 [Lentinula raphanica]|nr:hypothetical protein EV361DRAFT_920068 [Lentinula raphanica]
MGMNGINMNVNMPSFPLSIRSTSSVFDATSWLHFLCTFFAVRSFVPLISLFVPSFFLRSSSPFVCLFVCSFLHSWLLHIFFRPFVRWFLLRWFVFLRFSYLPSFFLIPSVQSETNQ